MDATPPFRKILVANRGEIACRVMATARRMGIATVAVYSEADARARHVSMADEAWPVGAAPARESYLSVPAILDAARRSGAEAVHPGYGFLSENADFAAACAAAGLVFIGPPAAAIRAMGSKAGAKALMGRAGVPLVPGYHGADQSLERLAAAAAEIGYPVLVKASAGGGGKGMRVVEAPEGLADALGGARREALAAFGDGRLLIERYLSRPRHIEIQVFADRHGNTVSLFERDCSIQRRHQKVIEEAPAPGMDPARRQAMGEAAIAAARAVGYVGAGTVEFIAEDGAFFFMEMNTRLQVEHPVTEMVTGLDLVEWQIRVASGEPLPAMRPGLRGHAIEARLYAEDPARGFLPATGVLRHLRQPVPVPGRVRVDTGVREGDAITPHYDPMIAKLVVWGEDRAAALRQLRAALAEYEVSGPRTNLGLLRAIAAHPAFAAAALDTGFIARHAAALLPAAEEEAGPAIWAAAALAVLRALEEEAAAQARASADPCSPWAVADAWRMNGTGEQALILRAGEGPPATVRAAPLPEGGFRLLLPVGGSVRAALAEDAEAGQRLLMDGVWRRLRVLRQDRALTVTLDGRDHRLSWEDPLAAPRAEGGAQDHLRAPIPGRVAQLLARPGERVAKGAPLAVIEAMKMELVLRAPLDGVVEAVRCAVGEMVEEGAELVSLRGAEAG
ncbi:3-methylcrotonyl-CoA carboxylase [Pseudoroseomonas rhizosphaerae]|uniref:3-methylcrotonyl-CoA carboxylase n=1 Tax=Teichococcus rhizosphaerae TaxID=1335062 RepID=A0A2C7ABX9_9PROT|nr:biotin carboxylase N-terminal domain-containing protein [Pseudoroseomonas rhizosphaerae]PHK94157.1 3-methylcrotonyl-CoA carboxylase [Pseudoroseomonas rhizosphaerae]